MRFAVTVHTDAAPASNLILVVNDAAANEMEAAVVPNCASADRLAVATPTHNADAARGIPANKSPDAVDIQVEVAVNLIPVVMPAVTLEKPVGADDRSIAVVKVAAAVATLVEVEATRTPVVKDEATVLILAAEADNSIAVVKAAVTAETELAEAVNATSPTLRVTVEGAPVKTPSTYS